MIKTVDSLKKFTLNADGTIDEDNNDFPYCPLYMFALANYDEEDAAKMNDEMLISLIKEYKIDAIKFNGQVYIDEEAMADLEFAIEKEFNIKPDL